MTLSLHHDIDLSLCLSHTSFNAQRVFTHTFMALGLTHDFVMALCLTLDFIMTHRLVMIFIHDHPPIFLARRTSMTSLQNLGRPIDSRSIHTRPITLYNYKTTDS